ncbi:TraB/GumN family protein [Pontivivens insulae]|uniref:TraB/GumN family protein n=1 Tax=Pontivivens insulae TaxID=1639689 RepID=A0A2R8A733_9RHOB|nr:TraB/GumN family protein [Pontivivens insulae]RED17929.1 hypothetical protein DFR53_0117 [Pontivivens insulae]SPF27818.1 hypothetical protein POI8812_00113 [Pontivivens insulae]
MLKPLTFLIAAVALCTLCAQVVHARCIADPAINLLTDSQRAQVDVAAAQVPNALGRLYEISGNNTRGMLFGTFHTAQPDVDLPDEVAARIEQAETLLVEVTTADQQGAQAMLGLRPDLFMSLDGKGLSDQLSPQDWTTLSTAAAPLGVPPHVADRFKPWFAATLVALPECELVLQARGGTTLDARAELVAQAAGVTVAPLETTLEIFEMMDALEDTVELAFLQTSISTLDLAVPVFIETLDYYQRGEIAHVAEFADILAADEIDDPALIEAAEVLETQLLDGRNANWMPTITAALEAGDTVIAVGALHLVGETGLVELLREQGYVVDRIVLEGETAQ